MAVKVTTWFRSEGFGVEVSVMVTLSGWTSTSTWTATAGVKSPCPAYVAVKPSAPSGNGGVLRVAAPVESMGAVPIDAPFR